MITFSNIVDRFDEFVKQHFFLQSFSYGSPEDLDLDKFETFPLLHLVYTSGSYADKVKTYSMEVYILDLPRGQENRKEFEKDVITQSELAAEDIIADLETGGSIFDFDFAYELLSASVTPLEEEGSNVLAGTLLNIAIGVPYLYDSCNAPLQGTSPQGTSTSYSARGLLRVKEQDGTPDVTTVKTITVPNGSLTDDGSGEVSLEFGGGLPTGVDRNSLVYINNEWVAGYPTSLGQISEWKRYSPNTVHPLAIGPSTLQFGFVTGGGVSYESNIRAGFALGYNVAGTALQASPVSVNSTVTVELKYDITLDTAGLVIPSVASRTGLFGQVAMTFPSHTAAGTSTHTVTSSVALVMFYQVSNVLSFSMFATVASSYRIHYIKITVDHA